MNKVKHIPSFKDEGNRERSETSKRGNIQSEAALPSERIVFE